MNIQHLHYAVEIAKTGSISQAAENLFMGQPNLSKAIKELEESLGISIFNRSFKGVVPTKEGEELLAYAKVILQQIEAMEAIYSPASRDKQAFRISVPRSSYMTYAFTSFVAGLDMEKEIELSFHETNSMAAIRNIEEEGFKLGIIRCDANMEQYFLRYLEHKGLKHREIFEFESLALMSKHHPLAEKKALTLKDLAPYIEIIHGDLTVPYFFKGADEINSIKGDRLQKRIHIYDRGSELDLLARIPETYMWGSPMPEDVLTRHGLVELPILDEPQRSKDILVFPANYTFNALDQLFLDALEQSKADALAFSPCSGS